MSRKVKAFLVYRASDGSLRVVKGARGVVTLAWDEIAFEVEVIVPDPWGRLAGAILIELPENGPAIVEVQQDPVTP